MREQIAEKVYAWLCKPEEERIIYELIDETNKVICEEIEKVGLTGMERSKTFIPCETCGLAITYPKCLPDFSSAECLDCIAQHHCEAQLQRILSLLKEK